MALETTNWVPRARSPVVGAAHCASGTTNAGKLSEPMDMSIRESELCIKSDSELYVYVCMYVCMYCLVSEFPQVRLFHLASVNGLT